MKTGRKVVLVVVGVMVGLWRNELSGALMGGFVGWLLVRTSRLQADLESLRAELKMARSAASSTQAESAAAAPHTVAAPPAAASAPAMRVPEEETEVPMPPVVAVPSPALAAQAPFVDTTPSPPAPSASPASVASAASAASPATPFSAPTPSFFDKARHWLFGGNTVVKAGVGLLFLGLAFLAKYASEHVQAPIELRLGGIAAVALVLLFLGWRLRERRPGYAQVLQGGAVAVLYLTLFAAFRFYGLVAAGPTFALMALVAALAAALAVLQNAQSLAAVGALGGFATPLLLSTGGGSHVALFSWYLLLDLGIAAIAWFRAWRALNLIGFAFSFGVGTAWGFFNYAAKDYLSAQLFLVAFFLVFVAVLLLPGRRAAGLAASVDRLADAQANTSVPPDAKRQRWLNGSLLFGLPVLAFGLQAGLVKDVEFGPALSALVMAAFYILLAMLMRRRPAMALAFEGCLAVGVVFLTLVIPLALDARSTSGAWALEGAGLVWLGWRQARRSARAFGYALILLAGLALMVAVDLQNSPPQWMNGTLLSGAMLVVGALLAAYVVSRYAVQSAAQTAVEGAHRTPKERLAEPLLIAGALVAAVSVLQWHVDALVDARYQLSAGLVVVAAVALWHLWPARRFNWRGLAWPVLLLAPLLLMMATQAAFQQPNPLANGGLWAWPLALAALGLALSWAPVHWPAIGTQVSHTLAALVVAVLGAAVGRGWLQSWGDAGSAWSWLGWLAVPALLLLALAQPALAQRWPVRDAPRAYQRHAGALLALALIGWTLLANALSHGGAQPLPHLPLLNPLDLGVALALFAVWRWAASAHGAAVIETTHQPAARVTAIVLGAAGFVWLNAMLVRGFHHLGGVPFQVDAWVHSLPVQTGLTLLWTLTALPLMWWSARRGQRAPWMVGAALLAAVVVKLLAVDLSASGTVTRIVSFMGAGLLMLVIGYVAPLPSREQGSASR